MRLTERDFVRFKKDIDFTGSYPTITEEIISKVINSNRSWKVKQVPIVKCGGKENYENCEFRIYSNIVGDLKFDDSLVEKVVPKIRIGSFVSFKEFTEETFLEKENFENCLITEEMKGFLVNDMKLYEIVDVDNRSSSFNIRIKECEGFWFDTNWVSSIVEKNLSRLNIVF